MNRNLLNVFCGLLAALLLSACGRGPSEQPAADASEPPLITRGLLFGNPERTGGKLSPDGRWLGYIAPRDGVMNVYVAPSDDPAATRPVTNDQLRGIRGFSFAYTGNHVLYRQDVGGDENFQVFSVDLTTGAERALTPVGARAGIGALSSAHPNEVVVSVNDRDPAYFDLSRIDLTTGAQTRLIENTQFSDLYVDHDLVLRYASKQTDDGGHEYFVRDGAEWRSWSIVAQEDSLTTGILGFTSDGTTLYMRDSRNRNTAALFSIDTVTGERTLVHEDDRADVGGVIVHPSTGVVQAASVYYLRNDWTAIDPGVAGDLERLRALGDGQIRVISRTLADDRWVVAITSSTAPSRAYIYDRDAGTSELWFETRPALAGTVTAPMHPTEIESRDGLTLVSYYTLPVGSDADGDGTPQTPAPMVLLVHGGPWYRDFHGFNSIHQWLANRGYAVLSRQLPRLDRLRQGVRQRGRPRVGPQDARRPARRRALGRRCRASRRETRSPSWAAATAAMRRSRADASRRRRFACGVDIVGPSNLVTLLDRSRRTGRR